MLATAAPPYICDKLNQEAFHHELGSCLDFETFCVEKIQGRVGQRWLKSILLQSVNMLDFSYRDIAR